MLRSPGQREIYIRELIQLLFKSAKTVLKGIDEEKREAILSDGGKNVVIAGPGRSL